MTLQDDIEKIKNSFGYLHESSLKYVGLRDVVRHLPLNVGNGGFVSDWANDCGFRTTSRRSLQECVEAIDFVALTCKNSCGSAIEFTWRAGEMFTETDIVYYVYFSLKWSEEWLTHFALIQD